MKKIIFFASTVIFFGLAPDVFAQGFVPLAPIPGLTQGATADTVGLANFFNNLYKYLIGVAAILAVIMIIWGGLEISTQDSVSKKGAGKEKIYNAIFGLVLVLSPVLVFSIINPSILNLSLNLPKLDTAPGVAGGGGGTVAQTPTTIDANGCSVRTGPYLETAVCPNQATVSSYSCKNGLAPTVGDCVADPSGKCVSGANVYCGKSTVVLYQKATHLFGLISYNLSGTVIPRDASIQNAFVAGCSADGGKMDTSINKLSMAYQSLTPGSGCPADSGITYNTADQYGVICYKETLTCKP